MRSTLSAGSRPAASARADLAAADAVVLAEEGRLDGITPPSTAAEAFTMADLAAIASELTGREIRRVIVSDAEWLDAKVAEGVPPKLAETLLGRRPRTMRDALAGILADRRPPCDQGSPNPPAAGR